MNSQKQEYFLLRRQKKIRMIDLAKYIGCSQSLISKYETGVAIMSEKKIQKYREYIEKN
ncbi:helix-turn-helix domain-containing protein [Domibacillus epiphyticus]|uniref:Transcriptional regulator n=1 Tax=Domibacillus epiphyticus TaxID=1714355 RepID=A0A1V2A7B1_9BACI|nr:helix-turn-helix transcriptional regulator [Domibacillus epiphyticus]OMP66878.1 transcriptional regulator [Domibacillus epiphyticus]